MRKYLFIIPAIFLFGCAGESQKSEKINVSTIYQKHMVRYATNDVLYLESEFHTNAKWNRLETEKSGDHIELSPPSQIVFNGKVMNKDNSILTGAMYTLKEEGWPETLTWEWTDNTGKKYTNSTKMNPIKIKKMYSEKSYRSDYIVEWEGGPVEEGEEVLVTLEGDRNGKSESTTKSTSKVGETQISFGYEIMKNYEGGISVAISRTKNVPLTEATEAGGHILIHYDGGFETPSTKTIWESFK